MAIGKKDLSKVVSSATLVFIGGIVSSTSTLFERIIIARALSVEIYGAVSTGIAIMGVGSVLALLGLDQGIPRYISRFENRRDIRGIWVTGILLSGTASLLIAIILLINAEWLTGLLFDQASSVRVLKLFAICVPVYVILHIGLGGVRGFENTIYRTIAYDLFNPGARILLLAGLLAAGVGILAAGYAYLIALTGAAIVIHILLNHLIPLKGSFNIHAKELLKFSMPLVFSSLISVLLLRADTILLALFRSSREVGLYTAAYPLALGLTVALRSFSFIYLPLASRLDVEDRRGEIKEIYQLLTKWTYIIVFPLVLTLSVFSKDILGVIFGNEYRAGSVALAILSVGFLTNSAVGGRDTLSAFGDTKQLLFATFISFIVNILLNLVLIPVYGFVGAAVASAISFLSLNVAVYYLLKARAEITPFSRWSVRTFLILPASLFPPAIFLSNRISLTFVTIPIFLMLAGLASLVLVCLGGCLQPEDKIPLELIEERTGLTVPLLRGCIPSEED